MFKGIWITWEKQRRNEGISAGLGLDLYEIIAPYTGLRRYIYSIIATLILINKKKPNVVAAQNPSMILAVLVILLKPIFNLKVIIDAHNAGIFPFDGKNRFYNIISRFIQNKADLTLVTNTGLKRVVERNNGIPFVLPDKIPKAGAFKKYVFKPVGEYYKIVYICTFSDDEPYVEIFQCAKMLSNKHLIYVTGRYQGKVHPIDLPENIKLLGYISEEEYWGLLSGCDIIIDLTTRKDCLVCGAYEGIAVGKPLILSDNQATRELFNKGVVYVKPNSESIRDGILECIKEYNLKENEIKILKKEMEQKSDKDIETLKGKIYN